VAETTKSRGDRPYKLGKKISTVGDVLRNREIMEMIGEFTKEGASTAEVAVIIWADDKGTYGARSGPEYR